MKPRQRNKTLCKTKYSVMASLFVASALLVTACGNQQGAAPEQDKQGTAGEVVVTSFGGKYDEVFTKYVIEPFESENPGVTVKLAPYTGIAKLAQGGGAEIDIVQLDDFDLIDAANQGMLAPLKKEEFESWDKLYPQAFLQNKDGDTYGLVNVFGAWGIAYDPQQVDKPESWNDFWKPEVAGKVAMMSQWIPDILMTAEATGAASQNMEPVWQAFQALTPSVAQYYSSFSTPESLFGTGEVTMVSWFDGRAYALKDAGKSVDFTIPKEGGVLIRSGMGVLADSEQQELARKLIDFSMKPEVQTGFAKELYYGPTNTEVQLEGDLADKVVYGKEKVEGLITPDWNEILANREEWLTKWTEATAQ